MINLGLLGSQIRQSLKESLACPFLIYSAWNQCHHCDLSREHPSPLFTVFIIVMSHIIMIIIMTIMSLSISAISKSPVPEIERQEVHQFHLSP